MWALEIVEGVGEGIPLIVRWWSDGSFCFAAEASRAAVAAALGGGALAVDFFRLQARLLKKPNALLVLLDEELGGALSVDAL